MEATLLERGDVVLIAVGAVALFVLAWILGQPWWVARRRRRVRAEPFPAAWRRILQQQVPLYRRLPADLRLRLKQAVAVFVAEKQFIGCGGLAVTDAMRVTIAAHACLLWLARRGEGYPELRQILVYPGPFFVERLTPGAGGVQQEQRQLLAGESWDRGQVILSWDDVVAGAAVADDGRNVALHEFAHQLDQETGFANGAPRLPSRERYHRWSQVLGAEFDALRQRAGDEAPLISAYGAMSPAEFFAVVTEVFFEQPLRLAAEHPALYAELARFYRLDPRLW